MSSAKSTKKSTKTEVAAPAPVAVAAPVVEKPAKATKAAKAAVAAVAAPVATPVPVAAPVEAVATTEEDISAILMKSIADLHDQLATLKASFSTAVTALKTIEKQAGRVVKKAERRKNRKSAKKSGDEVVKCSFTTPVKITDELCVFLGKAKGTEVSRSDVTKGVIAYARSHSLMDKQTIKTDAALRKLLTVTESDAVTILNLQKYLRRHYIKPAPAAN